MQRDGPLPALGIELGAAEGAAGGIWGDPLAAFRAKTGMHDSEDSVNPSEAAKGIVRSSEEALGAAPKGC